MADNTQVQAPVTGGDTVRDIDRSLNANPGSAKTQVMQLDAGGQLQESLVSAANPMPVLDALSGFKANVAMQILIELRVQSQILKDGLNTRDELDTLRMDQQVQIATGASPTIGQPN